MKVVPIEGRLGNLALIPLRCLTADRQSYRMLLMQPDGPIEGSEARIGHVRPERGEALTQRFLDLAVAHNVDLAVTPEYSTPWTVLRDIAERDERRPQKGGLWVLGCESISFSEIGEFGALLSAAGHFSAYEDLSNQPKSYVDTLVYVFWCTAPDGEEVLAFVFQFKTAPCRDKLDVEQRSLAIGTCIYSFNRGVNQIGLMSLICSDVFEFTDALVDEFHSNMLLLHVQLNPKPAHADYARYRSRLLSVASSRDVELLCLNWAEKVVENSNEHTDNWNNNSCSAFYAPPNKFAARDSMIVDAHRRGMYYSLVGKWHALYLNQEPHVILIDKQKLFAHGQPAAIAPSSFATILGRWIWSDSDSSYQSADDADDGFNRAVGPYVAAAPPLQELALRCPLSVERTLEYLMGAITKPDSWYRLDVLESMRVAENEALRRVTVSQDNDAASQGTAFRKRRLQRAEDAVTLPGKGVPWPSPLRDLEHGFRYDWSANDPYFNVIANDGELRAGLVYLADEADDAEVSRVYTVLQEGVLVQAVRAAVATHRDFSEESIRRLDRVCVVYRRDHVLRVWRADSRTHFDIPPGSSAVDIAGDGQ